MIIHQIFSRRCVVTAAFALWAGLPAVAQHFTQTNLVSNTGVGRTKKDTNLVNAWGMSRSSGSPWWISDNGKDVSTLYVANGSAAPLVVSVPGGPTGTVYNSTSDFELNGKPAVFLFATESGTILGWNGGNAASMVASKTNAVYKGLARATVHGKNYLYATDFHHGVIDVLDADFHYHSFGDRDDYGRGRDDDHHPFTFDAARRAGLVPFNIQNIGGNLLVTFAKQDAAKHDDLHGPGLGIVASFTPDGRLITVFEHGSWLNAPWGLAESPSDFGPFSHRLIVGNFGSGQIAAYNVETGRFLGLLEDASGSPLTIDGLWGLSFGSDSTAGLATTLYFTAGPNDESDGLFGTLTPVPTDPTQGNSN